MDKKEIGHSTTAGNLDVSRIKLPEFWPDQPQLWFMQVESQFALSGTTREITKYHHVVAQLDHKFILEVQDIISNPPDSNPYTILKSELVKRMSVSREHKVRQLLSNEEIGDRKPSQFLRHLRNLAGTSIPDDFLRTLWSNRLPHHIQSIIATQHSAPLDSVAELADKICEVHTEPNFNVHSVAVTNPFHRDSTIDELKQSINKLTQQVAALSAHGGRTSRFRVSSKGLQKSTSRSRSRSYSRNHSRFQVGVCWYHNKFANKAKKCISPCNFHAGNAQNSQ